MSDFNGTWDLTVKTFVGDQTSVIELKTDGDKLTGITTDNASGNSSELSNGKINGNSFTYQASVKLPMGLIEFTMEGEISRDGMNLSGTSKNAMGEFPFTAVKR